jgi:hypothetical protein
MTLKVLLGMVQHGLDKICISHSALITYEEIHSQFNIDTFPKRSLLSFYLKAGLNLSKLTGMEAQGSKAQTPIHLSLRPRPFRLARMAGMGAKRKYT